MGGATGCPPAGGSLAGSRGALWASPSRGRGLGPAGGRPGDLGPACGGLRGGVPRLADGAQGVGEGVQLVPDTIQGASDGVGAVQHIDGQRVWVELHGEGALDAGGVAPGGGAGRDSQSPSGDEPEGWGPGVHHSSLRAPGTFQSRLHPQSSFCPTSQTRWGTEASSKGWGLFTAGRDGPFPSEPLRGTPALPAPSRGSARPPPAGRFPDRVPRRVHYIPVPKVVCGIQPPPPPPLQAHRSWASISPVTTGAWLEKRPLPRANWWALSGSALLPWGMLVTAPPALETPCYPQAPHPALSHPGPCPLSPTWPQLLRGHGTGKDPAHPSYKVKLHLLRAWPWPGLDVATSPAGLPTPDFLGVLLREGCTVFSTVKWVRRPSLLAGSPSLGSTVGVSAYLSLSLASLKLSDTK